MRLLLALCAFWSASAFSSTGSVGKEFTESRRSSVENKSYEKFKENTSGSESQRMDDTSAIQSAKNTYLKFNNRVRVPGFISAAPIPQVGRIVGPKAIESTNYRMGDTLYVRWSGAPMPKEGEKFSTFQPAVVLQNLTDPTDFEVYLPMGPLGSMPKERRMAGYFYETTGRVRVVRIRGGLVEVVLEQLSGQVMLGNELMAVPPLVENVTPIRSGIQLAAAVICGSPHDRLSTTKRSVIYINRGSRDGIRVGRVFESLDTVKLDEAVRGQAPEISNGEAIVIHTTDSFSTAMITKQFDVIRVGSLLRTKQEENQIISKTDLSRLEVKKEDPLSEKKLPEVPNLEKLPGSSDETLPEPRKNPSAPPLSELDELEKSLSQKNLSPAEKARLDKLSRQEKLGTTRVEEAEEDAGGTPGIPTVENSFKEGKKSAKKDTKKSKKKNKNDEEELNLLMMQD